MALEEQDKSEQATPYKLAEARRRGQVSKSPEVTALVLLAGFTVILLATGNGLANAFARRSRWLLLHAGDVQLNRLNILDWVSHATAPIWFALSPLLIALLVLAVLINVVQTGPVLSSEPLKPDFTRLNPVNGLKRLFSIRIAFEIFKTLCKLGVTALALYICARYYLDRIRTIATLDPIHTAPVVLHLLATVVFTLLALFALVAALDVFFTRFEYGKKMRMSRRELKDEHKRREGDPEIRSRRRRLQQEYLKRTRATRRVKDADVIIVNPTHYAVALKYEPLTMPAPRVLALGAGHLAARIRQLARHHAVPVVRNPRLARALFKQCTLDGFIPESSYTEVAPLYRWLRSLHIHQEPAT